MEYNFCCSLFKSRVNSLGKCGISFLPIDDGDYFFFKEQARSQNYPEKSFIFQQAIIFCPFCGIKLKEWILSHREEFSMLAKEMEKYHFDPLSKGETVKCSFE